jgi:hypothetical protein
MLIGEPGQGQIMQRWWQLQRLSDSSLQLASFTNYQALDVSNGLEPPGMSICWPASSHACCELSCIFCSLVLSALQPLCWPLRQHLAGAVILKLSQSTASGTSAVVACMATLAADAAAASVRQISSMWRQHACSTCCQLMFMSLLAALSYVIYLNTHMADGWLAAGTMCQRQTRGGRRCLRLLQEWAAQWQ